MTRIHLLDESTINKIAAGEVIERPASVVKELVENSIDAGADEIIIKVKEGGKKQISVLDNGTGMDKEDLLLCVKKHATSKIQKIEDVYSIYSYGFRGEALATIAEVSKTEIISAREEDEFCNKLTIENGKVKDISQETKRKGTEINIYNLFYTIPARQKFLKTDSYELKRIIDWIKTISISNPKIKFKVLSDGKEILSMEQKENYGERVKAVFDLKLTKADYKDPVVSAIIYFSNPVDVLDSTLAKQQFYLNNRPIKNDTISKAIYKAFESKIPRGKKPNCFVFLQIDPHVVDINVHPQKLEVRVRNENMFYLPVYEAIKKKLESGFSVQSEDYKPELKTKIISLLGEKFAQTESISAQRIDNEKESLHSRVFQDKLSLTISEGSKSIQKKYKIIGQLLDTYILVETQQESLLIIDQHVAEERYYFEKFQQDYKENRKIESQSLLVPISLEFEPEEVGLIEEKKKELLLLGLEIDSFGKESVIVRKLPLIMNKIPSKEDLHNLILDVINEQGSFDSKLNNVIATMACKTSVKAETPLSEPVMSHIIERLFSTKNPYTCPHGRPIIIELTKSEIEKKIGRI